MACSSALRLALMNVCRPSSAVVVGDRSHTESSVAFDGASAVAEQAMIQVFSNKAVITAVLVFMTISAHATMAAMNHLTEELYRQTGGQANTMEAPMRTVFLAMCAITGIWVSREDGLACEIGLAIVATGLGCLVLILARAVQMLLTGGMIRWQRRDGLHHSWRLPSKGTSGAHNLPIEWIPPLNSPEDPLHNPHYSPEHQNVIDPDQWI